MPEVNGLISVKITVKTVEKSINSAKTRIKHTNEWPVRNILHTLRFTGLICINIQKNQLLFNTN